MILGSALQEAVCAREKSIAMIISRHYQPLAWAKWCRWLPRIVASIARIRDFYREITFHFESSVIPFIGRIAPSDTYRIWKRGSNLRADMTLAGFDGFRIRRSDQSSLSFLLKKKKITNALEGAGAQPTEAKVAHEVMSQTNMYRPGIDVTQADERIANGGDNDGYEDVLIAEERMQLDSVLRIGNSDGVCEDENHHVHDSQEHGSGGSFENCESNGIVKEKKSWFGWNKIQRF